MKEGTKKIKVLRIINRFNIGGPTYNATFLSAFLSDDFETLLVGGLPEEGEADSLHIVKEYGVEPLLIEEMKRMPNFSSDRIAYKKLLEIIAEFKPDIVHTHAAKAGALGRRAAIKSNVPVILHTFHGHVFHSYFGKLKTHVFKIIERRLAKKTTKIVAISELQKRELVEEHRICTDSKIQVVPLGFDLNKFQENRDSNRLKTRRDWNIADDEIAIGIIGRLAAIKNHLFFLECLERVFEKTEQRLRVFIVGDGDERELIENQIEKMHIPAHCKIELTSWIKDIASFNAGMDLICLSSKNEGTPVSLIEAQACNVCVLSTDVGGVKDVVSNGKTGIVVTQNTINEYTTKLRELIENDELRNKLAANGWEFVKQQFHYTRLVNDMEQLYVELIKNKK